MHLMITFIACQAAASELWPSRPYVTHIADKAHTDRTSVRCGITTITCHGRDPGDREWSRV